MSFLFSHAITIQIPITSYKKRNKRNFPVSQRVGQQFPPR